MGKANSENAENFYRYGSTIDKFFDNFYFLESKKRPKYLSPTDLEKKDRICSRLCSKEDSDKCDEIHLDCLFDGCKYYKKVNLNDLRKKSKKSS